MDHQNQAGDGNGKKNKKPPPRRAASAPIASIQNSPPAPPPTLQETLCRRRRRSDLFLFIIGVLICMLSLLHIFWHSSSLPHSHHVSNKQQRQRNGRSRRGKSALQNKLDGFVVKARQKTSGRIFGVNDKGINKKEAEKLLVKDMQHYTKYKQIGNTTRSHTVQSREKEQNHPHDNDVKAIGVTEKNDNRVEALLEQKEAEKENKIEPEKTQQKPLQLPNSNSEQDDKPHQPHPVAHLNCADHGGPTNQKIVDEIVFWSDIPSDASYLSPMHPLNDPHTPDDTERFLTFEPDSGGWNNIRMAMETALVMSHAMGRTLVLPPEQRMYLMSNAKGEQKNAFSFNDFFHLDAISIEHKGFKVITMEEFLTRVGTTGQLKDFQTKEVAYPPNNETHYGTGRTNDFGPLFKYLRSVGNTPAWDSWECALAIPRSTEPEAIAELETIHKSIFDGSYGKPKPTLEEFNGKPTPVNATLAERMREMLADRNNLCIYDKPLQESKLVHLKVDRGVRYLTHFYAFIFFGSWKQDLWSKRFVRDHLRYVDEIMCAAARVIEAVREHAKKNKQHNASQIDGIYDAMHVRRGDFQYPPTQLPADKLYELSKGNLAQGSTLYIATDERNKTYFDIFKKNYDVVFLDDFMHVIPDANTNWYGMIDQLVTYKSRAFYGTWWSTLSGYVNRMRGYYIAKHKLEGYKDGTMKSWYFTPEERRQQMRTYIPVRKVSLRSSSTSVQLFIRLSVSFQLSCCTHSSHKYLANIL